MGHSKKLHGRRERPFTVISRAVWMRFPIYSVFVFHWSSVPYTCLSYYLFLITELELAQWAIAKNCMDAESGRLRSFPGLSGCGFRFTRFLFSIGPQCLIHVFLIICS